MDLLALDPHTLYPHALNPTLPLLQIRLHDVGGVWIFLAACIGLGAAWNLAIWLLARKGAPGGRGSGATFGPPATLAESVEAAQARLDMVGAEAGLG